MLPTFLFTPLPYLTDYIDNDSNTSSRIEKYHQNAANTLFGPATHLATTNAPSANT
jgi:hypothetical protein